MGNQATLSYTRAVEDILFYILFFFLTVPSGASSIRSRGDAVIWKISVPTLNVSGIRRKNAESPGLWNWHTPPSVLPKTACGHRTFVTSTTIKSTTDGIRDNDVLCRVIVPILRL
jgi:hypothetical protein